MQLLPVAWLLLSGPRMNTAQMELPGREEAASQTLVHLPAGLLGFESIKKYILVSNPEEDPFHWLQVIDDPSLSFVVVSPFMVLPDYQPDIPAEDARLLNIEEPSDALILNVVTLRAKGPSTVNLKGPIVINRFTMTGKQIVITNAAAYSVQHPLPASEVAC